MNGKSSCLCGSDLEMDYFVVSSRIFCHFIWKIYSVSHKLYEEDFIKLIIFSSKGDF